MPVKYFARIVDARKVGAYCALRNGSFVLYRKPLDEVWSGHYLHSGWASYADCQQHEGYRGRRGDIHRRARSARPETLRLSEQRGHPMVGKSGLTRRSFLGLSAAAVAAPVLAGCGGGGSGGGGGAGGGGSTEPLKFWNMPWGSTTFNPLDQKITEAYKPAAGLPPVTYQVIQWANFNQTFASAVASKTNPAVSSGGGTQVFQYEAQGGIAYVDELYATWKTNGLYDDFLPGLIDTLKVDKGYAAIPYNLDMRVIWVNKAPAGPGRGQGAHRLAVLPGRGRCAEEDRRLRVRHGSGRRRLHRTACDRLLDDQQRWWALRCAEAAELLSRRRTSRL